MVIAPWNFRKPRGRLFHLASTSAGTWPSGEPALLGFDKTEVLTRRYYGV